MIQLEAPANKGCLLINKSPYPKSSLFFPMTGDSMEIRIVGYGDLVVNGDQKYSEYSDSTGTPFATMAALRTFIIDNAFVV